MTQWIVAWMFAPGSLALFAVGISFNATLAVLRHSVGNAVMPRMSAVHAAGDTARALELNNRGNVAIGVVVFPVVVFIWTFAAPLIELLYTADYLEAVAVLRVYLVLLIVMSIELATVLWILEQGRFVATVSAVMLIASFGLVLAGAALFGLVGVAWGVVAAEFANRLINFRRAAKVLGISFGRLQDWPTLGKTLAAAVGSGAMAGYGQATVLPDAAPVWQLLVGGGMACIGYPLLLFLLRAWWLVDCLTGRRGWLDARG